MQPDEPDDIGINLMQPQMIGPLILQQQPAPATAPFNFASFMRESGGDTTTFSSAVRKADAHLPPGPIRVGMSHHPIHRKHILMFCAYSTYFTYSVEFAIFRKSIQHKAGFSCNAHKLVSCGLDANYRRV